MKAETRIRLKYVIADYLAANAGWLVFNVLRYRLLDAPSMGFLSLGEFLLSHDVWIGQALVPLMMLAIFYLSGYYNNVAVKSRLQVVLTSLASVGVASAVIVLAMLVNDLVADRMVDYRLLASLVGVLSLAIVVPRLVLTKQTACMVRRGEMTFPTLVIGSSSDLSRMEQRLEAIRRVPTFSVVGYADASSSGIVPRDIPSCGIDEIEEVCRRKSVANIVFIPDGLSTENLLAMVNRLFPLDCHIYISPDASRLLTSRLRQNDIKGEPLIDISRSDMPESTVNIKRVSDVIVSAIALVLLSPLLGLLGLLVRLDSPGPVIYRQRRVGRHKVEFDIYKFRTMRADAEKNGPALSNANDRRVTPVGRILRKYRLDELPQFWNVLKGDMSIVGPRPEREFFIRRIVEKAPYYTLLHQVRPGITSWGMVKYGYAEDVDAMIERSRYDLLYIENISFIVDMKILLHTINTVLTGKGV